MLHGFKGKDGKPFDARLRLEDNKVVFLFETSESIGECPQCGGAVVESSRAWGCANWRESDGGCRFAIWKEVAGRRLTKADVLVLLKGGKVGPYPFHSREGKEFTAFLALDPGDGHRLQMSFPADPQEPDPDYEEDE